MRSSFWADVWVLSHFLHAARMERRRSGWWTIGGNGVIFGTRWHTTIQDWPAWPILNNAWQRNAHLYCLQQRPISILKLPSLLSPVKLFIQQRLTDSGAAPSTFAEADERRRQWLSLVFVGHVFLDSLSPCGLSTGLLSKTASWAWGELRTAAEFVHLRLPITPGAPQHDE